jgi:hypothetical protein
LIDILNLSPALIDPLLEFDQTIVGSGQSQSADNENEEENDEEAATADCEFIHKRWVESRLKPFGMLARKSIPQGLA